jgi:hypothetical protein
VRTGFGVVGEKENTLVTDGTLVRQSAPLTFDEVTPKALPDSIYGYMSGNSDTFGVHQFWVKVVDYSDATGYSTIQSSYSDIWRPVRLFISRCP